MLAVAAAAAVVVGGSPQSAYITSLCLGVNALNEANAIATRRVNLHTEPAAMRPIPTKNRVAYRRLFISFPHQSNLMLVPEQQPRQSSA